MVLQQFSIHGLINLFVDCWPGAAACTCNPANLEANFCNSVCLIPVGGNSPSLGSRIDRAQGEEPN